MYHLLFISVGKDQPFTSKDDVARVMKTIRFYDALKKREELKKKDELEMIEATRARNMRDEMYFPME